MKCRVKSIPSTKPIIFLLMAISMMDTDGRDSKVKGNRRKLGTNEEQKGVA